MFQTTTSFIGGMNKHDGGGCDSTVRKTYVMWKSWNIYATY